MRSVAFLLASCAFLALPCDSVAQQTAGAGRVSTTFGLSKGTGALTCNFCTGQRKGGLAGMVGVETRFRPGVRLGVEADWWMHSGGGSTRSVLAAMPVALFYASPSSPAFFKLGLGIGRFSASSDEEELRTTAIAGVLGAGYEIRLSNRNAVVPYVSWLSGSHGTMRLNGARVTPFGGLSLLQYGLAFSKR